MPAGVKPQNRIRAREIKEHPQRRLHHSSKAVPEQSGLGVKTGRKISHKAFWQRILKCSRLDTGTITSVHVKPRQPNPGGGKCASALILVTAVDGAGILYLL